jgi:hypothetical protein
MNTSSFLLPINGIFPKLKYNQIYDSGGGRKMMYIFWVLERWME